MKRAMISILAGAAMTVAGTVAGAAAGVERIEEGNRFTEGVPGIPAEIAGRLGQYLDVRSASFVDWHPGGDAVLIATRFGHTRQLHLVSAPLGARKQITFYDEPVRQAWLSPDRDRESLLFLGDIGGSEDYQIFHRDLASGATRPLTEGSGRRGGVAWSNRGDRFAYYQSGEGGDWDIYLRDPDRDDAELIRGGAGTIFPIAFSPDDLRLLYGQHISVNESRLFVLELASGDVAEVNPGAGKVSYGSFFSRAVAFTGDGGGLYFASDEGGEFRRLRHYDLATGAQTVLTADIPWDVTGLDLAADGQTLAFTANEGGRSRLYLLETATGAYRAAAGIPTGIVTGIKFSPDGSRLAMTINRATAPADVYVYDPAAGELARWTESEVGGLDTAALVEPEFFHYPTFDEAGGESRQIPAFIYRPKGKAGPFPVVVSIHGGPESQARPGFSATIQYWVNELGVAVIRPNVRGSAGYGKSYLLLDNGLRREDTVRDIGALLDWIGDQPGLDADRVLLSGGSYGGYMVLGSMTRYDDRVRAAVERYGISDFATFLRNTRGYRRDLRRAEYGDERDPELAAFFARIAPMNNAQKITKPLFVLQGANDPRVPASESEQMVAKIRAGGGEVWYVLFKDEGHGFRKKPNADYAALATAVFIKRYLLGE